MTCITRPRRIPHSRRVTLTIDGTTINLTRGDARRLAAQLHHALDDGPDAEFLYEALARVERQPTVALRRLERDAVAWELHRRRGWARVDVGALFGITGQAVTEGIARHHQRLRNLAAAAVS